MNFLQFFIWGSWLTSFGGYLMETLNFEGFEVGKIYMTMGIAALFMPILVGIVADKWINAERLFGISHLAGGALLIWASTVSDYNTLYWVMFGVSIAYMPTIALNNSVSYSILERNGFDIVKVFPTIRVWGTIGFIIAMWLVDLLNITTSATQLYIAACSAILLGLYSFSMPACPPENRGEGESLIKLLGLDAFILFKQRTMSVFFIFSMFLGAALQITNTFGQPFLLDFKNTYPDSFVVENPGILMSISQISETLFILTIPFFLRKFGIKKVMLLSIFAWILRFGFFAIGDPGSGFIWLVLSMIIYGMAFDFFNISGSLFVEIEVSPRIRSSAQGLFMIMTNGFGAFVGAIGSGWLVSFFTQKGIEDWPSIWFTFAAYSLIIGIAFMLLFRYKHNPEKLKSKV